MAELSAEELEAIEKELVGQSKRIEQPVQSGALKVFIDPKQLKADLAYSEATIGEATMQQASLFSHYAALASRAAHQHDTVKNALELTEALIDKELRDAAAATGQKLTEVAIGKAIVLDERYQAAQKKVADAKLIMSLCEQAREAFRQRMFMLIQAGKDQMIERQGELRQSELDNRRNSLVREMAGA
jgi:hypothetical protein